MTKIQLRRDTAANWSTNNPTPSAGEPCFETDTGKLKIGDGITAYNSLPYQGGSGDVTSAGNNTFTGTNIFKGKSLNVGDDNGYADVASFSGETYTVGDQKDTTIFNPLEIGASFNSTVLKSDVLVLETDTASSTKKAYSIMTKSPTNNEYMAHMSMPSSRYINLTLGANGTKYTAPADGWIVLTVQPNPHGTASFCEISQGSLDVYNCNNGPANVGADYFTVLTPIKKGEFIVYYRNAIERAFRFFYTIGSEPQS